jgi:glycosyltransferase involved in cell wall biosynthesis
MRPLYNLDRIAEAARILCEKDPDVYFVFTYLLEAKDDVYEQRVHEIVGDLVTAKRVRFEPGVTHRDMADYYRLAMVTISIPSSDGTPMSVLESLACGTPVVVSDIPNYDEHYIEAGKTAQTARIDDVGSIVSALDSVIVNRALAEQLVTEGRRRVEGSGSYESQMTRMEELYQQLVSTSRTIINN